MIRLMIVLLLIAVIAPLFIKDPNGKSLMSLSDWQFDLPTSLQQMADKLKAAPVSESTSEWSGVGARQPSTSQIKTVYKWQDEDGVWQFSDSPPAAGHAETMTLDGKINTMAALQDQKRVGQKREGQESPRSVTADGPAAERPETSLQGLSVSPESVQEMINTVGNLQQTIDQRKADMDKVTGSGN